MEDRGSYCVFGVDDATKEKYRDFIKKVRDTGLALAAEYAAMTGADPELIAPTILLRSKTASENPPHVQFSDDCLHCAATTLIEAHVLMSQLAEETANATKH